MSIEAVQFLPPGAAGLPAIPEWDSPVAPLPPDGRAGPPGAQVQAAEGTFAHWFTQQLQQVSGDLRTADLQLQDLAAGTSQNLHQVMISLEEARLSFQLLMQVRNRVLEAYQDVMRMQI